MQILPVRQKPECSPFHFRISRCLVVWRGSNTIALTRSFIAWALPWQSQRPGWGREASLGCCSPKESRMLLSGSTVPRWPVRRQAVQMLGQCSYSACRLSPGSLWGNKQPQKNLWAGLMEEKFTCSVAYRLPFLTGPDLSPGNELPAFLVYTIWPFGWLDGMN